MYSEVDLTWSSMERLYDYSRVTWTTERNGIPRYTFFDKNGKQIEINVNKV